MRPWHSAGRPGDDAGGDRGPAGQVRSQAWCVLPGTPPRHMGSAGAPDNLQPGQCPTLITLMKGCSGTSLTASAMWSVEPLAAAIPLNGDGHGSDWVHRLLQRHRQGQVNGAMVLRGPVEPRCWRAAAIRCWSTARPSNSRRVRGTKFRNCERSVGEARPLPRRRWTARTAARSGRAREPFGCVPLPRLR